MLPSLALAAGVNRIVRPSACNAAVPPWTFEIEPIFTRRALFAVSTSVSFADTTVFAAMSSLVVSLSSTATGGSLTGVTETVLVRSVENSVASLTLTVTERLVELGSWSVLLYLIARRAAW